MIGAILSRPTVYSSRALSSIDELEADNKALPYSATVFSAKARILYRRCHGRAGA